MLLDCRKAAVLRARSDGTGFSPDGPEAIRRAAEILVRGGSYAVIRERERYEDLVRGEATAAAADAFKASGFTAACICSSDAIYAEQAEATAKALKAAGAKLVLMAGRAGDREAALKAAGVDQFLFAGADAVATLADLQKKLG